MQIRRTRPYSPWQNGKVERSGKILYGRKVFTSEKELNKQVQNHESRYNSMAHISLLFICKGAHFKRKYRYCYALWHIQQPSGEILFLRLYLSS